MYFRHIYRPLPLEYNLDISMLSRHPENVEIEKVKAVLCGAAVSDQYMCNRPLPYTIHTHHLVADIPVQNNGLVIIPLSFSRVRSHGCALGKRTRTTCREKTSRYRSKNCGTSRLKRTSRGWRRNGGKSMRTRLWTTRTGYGGQGKGRPGQQATALFLARDPPNSSHKAKYLTANRHVACW